MGKKTFRDEVTRAAIAEVRQNGGICPECGKRIPRKREDELLHAEDCIDLRANMADTL